MKNIIFLLNSLLIISSCNFSSENTANTTQETSAQIYNNAIYQNEKYHVTHVIVSLCDNKYQGIAKVPEGIGNGQDAPNNLYWGCAYGVKTYFKNQAEWTIAESKKMVNDTILERVIFRHKNGKNILVADAYDGQFFKHTTDIYLKSLSGQMLWTIPFEGSILGINGNAELLVFVGHNGLMEFDLPIENYENTNKKSRDAIILACISKKYFEPYLQKLNVNSLVLSTGLMSPEAYTLDAALDSYIDGNEKPHIRLQAAKAYDEYQKCGVNAALGLLVNE